MSPFCPKNEPSPLCRCYPYQRRSAVFDHLYIFRIKLCIFNSDFRQFRLDFWLLFRFFQIVFPSCLQTIIRMSLYPKTAKAIFYHVTDDPIRREEFSTM